MERAWHALDAEEVRRAFDVDPRRGLDAAAVRERREHYGPNELPSPPAPSAFTRLLRQFADPLVGALLVAAVIAATVAISEPGGPHGHPLARFGDTFAILLIVGLNAALGFFQEQRAENALAALKDLTAPRALVLRDGRTVEIDARDIVPGDILQLEAGSAVAADVRLVDTAELGVDESALTGESLPVDKDGGLVLAEATPVSDRTNMAFLGTLATRGHGAAVVVATGGNTELGRIGALIREAPDSQTPLEARIGRLGRWILLACLSISALLIVIGLARGTDSWPVLLLTAVSLAVAAIPEGLPAITTITLALGVQRMARAGAVIRRLPAVETLGSATVICTDKTGTVTENRMQVKQVESLDQRWDWESHHGLEPSALLEEVMETAVLCNTADLGDAATGSAASGDPTELALLEAARDVGITRAGVLERASIRKVIPFDSARKYMATKAEHADGLAWHVKGSPEALLPRCTAALTATGTVPLDTAAESRVLARTDALADDGLRVLALARGQAESLDDLTLLGIMALHDPPRPEAREAIATCHTAGIRVVMITGDHPRTALAIAKTLGLSKDRASSLTGSDIQNMGPEELESALDSVSVFARVSPEQKLDIVRALMARGNIVAMTGDGVNDAPALKEAQIGIAMGRRGTEVARQASEMVLSDDNFATIVDAVREGRSIFSNIQKFVFFLNSSNAGLVLAVIVGSFFDTLPHLSPLQLLWINLVTNGLPALALGVDPTDPDQMNAPPRPVRKGLFGLRDLAGVLFVGSIMGAAALGVSALPRFWPGLFSVEVGLAHGEALTMAFSVLALSPLFHAFNARSPHRSILRRRPRNRALWLAVLASATIHLAAVALPPLHPVFKTTLLSPLQWAVVIAASVLPLPAVEIAKWIYRVFSARHRERTASTTSR